MLLLVNMAIEDTSSFEGTINIAEIAAGGATVESNAVVTNGVGCSWTLTGDCAVTGVDNKGITPAPNSRKSLGHFCGCATLRKFAIHQGLLHFRALPARKNASRFVPTVGCRSNIINYGGHTITLADGTVMQ